MYDVCIEWDMKVKKGVIPFDFKKYAPQISISGQRIFNGSAWSVLCFSYDYLDRNKTKAYLRFLNMDATPNILENGTRGELYEGPTIAANGEVVGISDFEFKFD